MVKAKIIFELGAQTFPKRTEIILSYPIFSVKGRKCK